MTGASNCADRTEAARPQLRVRSARELFQALSAPDAPTRLSALHAVRLAPDTALSFGLYEGRDVIDVMLQQTQRVRAHIDGHTEWFSWIGALAAFRDRRVVELFISLLGTEEHAELLLALAEYLGAEPIETMHAKLAPALMQNESTVRARAVAHILAESHGGSTREQLRIRLLEGCASAALPLFTAAPSEWVNELTGPFQFEARCQMERQKPSAFAALAQYWDQLSETVKRWLIESSREQNPVLTVDLIRKALISPGSDELSLAALQAAATLEQMPEDINALTVPFLSHSDERLRLAAVAVTCSPLNWVAFLENESSVLVRESGIKKHAASCGLSALPDLLRYMGDPDWRIRAAAADAILSLGTPAVRSAMELLPLGDEALRAAIARMVIQLEDEELLTNYLHRCNVET